MKKNNHYFAGLLAVAAVLILNSCSSTRDFMDMAHKKYGNRNYVANSLNESSSPQVQLNTTKINSIKPTTASEFSTSENIKTINNTSEKVSTVNNELASIEKVVNLNSTKKPAKITRIASNDKIGNRKEVIAQMAAARKMMKAIKSPDSPQVEKNILYVLAILFPALAVYLATEPDWTKVLIAFVLSWFFWIPGIIYAIWVISKT
jgi:uncharacterized membrane protein YqaE (UPF0057 family)